MAFSTRSGGQTRTQTALADINITPLVDVVLVLLLIFMLTAPVLQSGIEVAVPHTRSVNQLTEQRTVVTIDKDQNVFLQTGGPDKPINLADLTTQLRSSAKATRQSRRSTSRPTVASPSEPSPPSWTQSNRQASRTSAS